MRHQCGSSSRASYCQASLGLRRAATTGAHAEHLMVFEISAGTAPSVELKQRSGRRLAAAHRRHQRIEEAGADFALVLDRRVAPDYAIGALCRPGHADELERQAVRRRPDRYRPTDDWRRQSTEAPGRAGRSAPCASREATKFSMASVLKGAFHNGQAAIPWFDEDAQDDLSRRVSRLRASAREHESRGHEGKRMPASRWSRQRWAMTCSMHAWQRCGRW